MAQINSDVVGLWLNGDQIPIKEKSFQGNIGGYTRTSVMTANRRIGSTKSAKSGECSFTVPFIKGFKPSVLDVENAQIRIRFDNGAEFVMNGADLMEGIELGGGEGDINVAYEGDKWEQTKLQ